MSHDKTTQPTPDSYGVIRATGEQPPRGFNQVCLCGFDRFSGAFYYCPQCGSSAQSHSRYERKEQNTEPPIVLNPRTLAKAMESLERAETHAGNLALQHESIEPDLTMLEGEIAQATNLLSRVIMRGVKANGGI